MISITSVLIRRATFEHGCRDTQGILCDGRERGLSQIQVEVCQGLLVNHQKLGERERGMEQIVCEPSRRTQSC